ncbi:ewing's tumor-associated antigen 1 isoform X1 [Nannospalax galili]|uniref:ewing's tumor-associated antigen 1 isoform X1 n=3 Tax=Nannospalax galili TaxID=1026970 RepID=UPI00111BD118|nr:ewing's tumor-associated antigen 1 isoform X1 [Nannospalax galili]
MSRRRKHGDGSAPRSAPRGAAAGDARWSSEPCSGRLKEARGSRAGARPSRQPRRAAGGERSPRERFETPTGVLKMDFSSCTFSSPNDPDGQNDIFWDQNSPMTKQLGKGRKKQICSTDSDEISNIVNRIAPQDEKPVTNSMLGVWIGATAIPCTPSIAKEKTRLKVSCTRLKTQNREKELMKLAKQFDKNMEELDVIQEQNRRNDFIETTSEAGSLHNCKDYVQMESYDVSEIDRVLTKRPIKRNTCISVSNEQNGGQKPFDQTVEAAFNAIFDGSTQMCSGRLSQDVSDSFMNSSNTTFGKKSALIEEKVIANETLVTENLTNTTSPERTAEMPKSCVVPCREPEASSKHIGGLTAGDFEDDWENLLGNEPFIMQNAEIPSTTAQVTDPKGICALDKSSKLPFTGNRMRCEEAFHKIVTEDKIQDCDIVADFTEVKENNHRHFVSNIHASEKTDLYKRNPHEQKYEISVNPSLKAPVNTDPFDSTSPGIKNSVFNPNQANTSKLDSDSFFDDWNDPSLANEMIKACHQLETTWGSDDVDDDLLYQACDDIERLTQQENKDSRGSESINNSSRQGARNTSTASKRGSHLVQSKHRNVGETSVQTSLTGNSEISKSVKVEKRELCRDYPSVLNTTTNLSVCSKNPNVQVNNLHAPIQVNSSRLVLAESQTSNVSLGNMNIEIATDKKLSTHQLSHNIPEDEVHSGLNKILFSKFTFKRKNSQLNKNCITGNMPTTKVIQYLGEEYTDNSLLGEADQWQSSVTYSESLKQSSKEYEEKNRKYSPEEIQRKRQQALFRRMAKAQASSINSAPV